MLNHTATCLASGVCDEVTWLQRAQAASLLQLCHPSTHRFSISLQLFWGDHLKVSAPLISWSPHGNWVVTFMDSCTGLFVPSLLWLQPCHLVPGLSGSSRLPRFCISYGLQNHTMYITLSALSNSAASLRCTPMWSSWTSAVSTPGKWL